MQIDKNSEETKKAKEQVTLMEDLQTTLKNEVQVRSKLQEEFEGVT